jgi:cell division protein FtsB
MAKALFGHVSATDPRITAQLTAENRRLQQRVADLEDQILRLKTENDALVAAAVNVLDGSMQPA